jgi:hypothetical protein
VSVGSRTGHTEPRRDGRAEELETRRRLGPRFGPEAGLILGAAALAVLLELGWAGIVAVILGAWLAIAAFEIVRARVRPAVAGEEPAPQPPPERAEPANRGLDVAAVAPSPPEVEPPRP